MKVKDLGAIRWSVTGDIQHAILYDTHANADIGAGCSMEYAIKHYGEWSIDRITAGNYDIILHIWKGE